jgi:hypothetical protein
MSSITRLKSLRNAASAAAATTAMLAATQAQAAVTISTGATSNMTCKSGVCTPTAATAVLNIALLQKLLAGGDVTVTSGTGTLADHVEDIFVATALTWASSHGLTLDAHRTISVTKPVSVAGPGALTLTTNDGGKKGELSFAEKGSIGFLGLSNWLTIDGEPYVLVNTIAKLATDIAHKPKGHFALAKNYNAAKDGTYTTTPIAADFGGTFEGLGNSISFLSINAPSTNAALFASIASGGIVRDIGLSNVTVQAGTGPQNNVGALAVVNAGTIERSYATGNVFSQAGSVAGGLVADNEGLIRGSHASSIFVAGDLRAGGLASTNYGTIADSYSTGSVLQAKAAGGIVGFNQGMISQSYATGPVCCGIVGGLVGINYAGGQVTQTYATGAVTNIQTGTNAIAGGLIGYEGGTTTQSYSTGLVTGTTGAFIGGLDGEVSTSLAIVDTYWDLETSGVSDPGQGAGNIANQPGITGLTTAQFLAGLPTGFDSKVWTQKSGVNGGFPYLKALPQK